MFASCSSSSMRPGLCTVSAPLLAAPTTSPTAHTSSPVLSSSSSSSSSSTNFNQSTSLSSPNAITTTSTLSGSEVRISLTISPDLTAAIGSSNLPPSARFLALHLLHQQTLYFLVQVKSRVRELYHQTCLHFQQQGMLDTDLFGLALICDGEYLFAEPDSKLSKYAPKSWRSSHNHGLDTNGRPALGFYFRVQFYVDSPLLLRDETTRHHYYLQLRLNTAAGAAAEHTTRLAGLALQADIGDHTQPSTVSYRPEDYVPPAMRQPAVLRNVEAAHRSLRNLPRQDARLRFIATACQLQEPVNAHVFRLRASKAETAPGSLLLAVCARGLRVCQENNPHPSVFLWSSIGKLSFERKKFEIRTGHEKLTLYTTSDDKSRLLLNLCKAAHQFSMAVAPRLTEAKQLHQQQQQNRQEEEDADAEDADQRLRWLDCDQRISVISSTSSNTTSGIVSDRVHSEDELEIMITSPPAPSTESLALAHLLDSAPASSRTSAASAAAALGGGSSVAPSMASILPALVVAVGGSMSGLTSTTNELLLDETERQGACSDTSAKTIASESGIVSGANGAGVGSTVGGGSSGGAINGGGGRCTAGSQCSSNCSTVVVTPAFTTKSKGRRPSTSSSLELGYSHTAQNSAVSDATCIELDIREPVYSAGPAPSSHTSGVYTLTSSDQYTLSSTSEQYTTTSERYSSTGESYSRTVDQVDGAFRDRSNSNVSNSGSFRGDGSDPTDNQQTLLSADELSDLIVGRYPSCKSVSNTLDSDSDYVTLPSTYQGYAPIPPKRIDSARPPPPPYGAQFLKLSDNNCEMDDILSEISIRDPPPYPESAVPPPPPVYPSEEVAARFITTRPPNILTAHTSLVGINSSPSYSVPPIPPKVPRPTSLISCAPSNGTLASSVLSSSMLASSSLSIASSKGSLLVPCAFLPPPPPPTPRQPPPPPPIATVYTSQLSRSQIEQYRQQMYSDVDFVVFPLKEPAISKQEYLEAKQGSLLAALAQTQPVFYRSTPYLGRYASSQNLSDTYVQLPVYGAPSIASTGSLEPVPPPLPPNRPSRFMRTQSDDNILNSIDSVQPVQLQPPKFRRLPPPPPPPSSQITPTAKLLDNSRTSVQISAAKQNALDIRTLRETSKKMDLPLISALCNDRSLIKQTKAFVMPKHPNEPMPRHVSAHSAKMKYPVSGLSSTRMNKVSRKPPSISHRHPGDKLPDLPKDSSTKVPGVVTTRATPNNYVFTDPRVKHKTMQSHS